MTAKIKSIFAISDVHGCATELEHLLKKLPIDSNSLIVFLGDYIDRGLQSKEVVDIILQLKKKHHVITLMGNHEQMFLAFLKDKSSAEAGMFIYNGGSATLASYGSGEGKARIPADHIKFFSDLKFFFQTDDYIFVHAGLPDVPISELEVEKHKEDMLWIRDEFFESKFKWDKVIVHGHTPIFGPELLDQRINVDTGCCFNNKLTAIQLPEKKIYSVDRDISMQEICTKADEDRAKKDIKYKGTIPVSINLEGENLQLETVDYNEYGMLLKDPVNIGKEILEEEQDITGDIGTHSRERVTFEGFVIRAHQMPDGVYYAVKFTKLNA